MHENLRRVFGFYSPIVNHPRSDDSCYASPADLELGFPNSKIGLRTYTTPKQSVATRKARVANFKDENIMGSRRSVSIKSIAALIAAYIST